MWCSDMFILSLNLYRSTGRFLSKGRTTRVATKLLSVISMQKELLRYVSSAAHSWIVETSKLGHLSDSGTSVPTPGGVCS